MENVLTFIDDNGDEINFRILEETRINNTNYILVAEDIELDDETVYIMKDTSNDTDKEALYEFVDDDDEMEALMKIFNELLGDDIDIKK